LVWETEGDLNWEGTSLDFKPLPRTRYTVELTVTDDTGAVHTGSTWFETGKMGEPWQGRWIGIEGEPSFAPILSGEFTAIGEVASARLYMVGLGVYSAALNGRPFTDELLAPGLWYFEEETQYQTYDVTHFIREDNRLEVTLGNGWYKGRFGLDREPYNDKYGLLAELHITLSDGSVTTLNVVAGRVSWMEANLKKNPLLKTKRRRGDANVLWDLLPIEPGALSKIESMLATYYMAE